MEQETIPAETTGQRDESAGEEETKLARNVGPVLLLLFVVGDILGGGIYTLAGAVGAEVGGAIWLAFLTAFVVALLTACSYAELVSKYPRAAGAALYVNKAFDIPFLTFMIAFAVMASGITSASTLARGFGGDALSAFVDIKVIPVAIAFMLVIALINARGIAESVRANAVLTCIEVGGLLLVIVIGLAAFGEPASDFGRNLEFKEGVGPIFAILSGAGLAFYALIGFEDSVNIAEETERPSRNYPRILFGGLAIAGLLYTAVLLVSSTVIPTGELAKSSAPLVLVGETGPLGVDPKVFSAITLFALANGALINMIMASRLVYGMSEEGIAPGFFGRVLPGRKTPITAIAFTTLLGLILVSTGDLASLADTTVMLLLIAFTAVNISVLVLRRDPVDHDHFTAPVFAPLVGIAASIYLIAENEAEVFVRAGLLLLLGLAFWLVAYAGGHRPGKGKTERATGAP
ncbi:MAG: APC family permease [Solirubrobacterales bacterium]|nr:APC family permease [Solirubrobacterales bacterium]MCO5327128.1 APC family permease [Solirubrobacterales bacterium]